MEIEGTDGSKTLLKPGSTIDFGRGFGFTSDDRTVSRRQILFQIHNPPSDHHEDETEVSFEVVGRNPIWVYSNRDGEVRTFRKFERGEMENGDMFCVSANKPIWFTLKRIDFVKKELEMETQLAESLQSSLCPVGIELDFGNVDISGIDPVQEFGFLVVGHEFDGYPKRMIREIKNWNWFIEDERAESDTDDDSDRKGRKGRKRKKKGEGDDDEWTGESGDENELPTISKKLQGSKYITRSKDKPNAKRNKPSTQQKTRPSEEEYEEEEDEDEEDETLGGFIVDDAEEGVEVGDEEEEEEEFDADEDDEE